jgi:hypothetical protein
VTAGALGFVAVLPRLIAIGEALYGVLKLIGPALWVFAQANPVLTGIAAIGAALGLLVLKIRATGAEWQAFADKMANPLKATTRGEFENSDIFKKISGMKASGASREDMLAAIKEERDFQARKMKIEQMKLDLSVGEDVVKGGLFGAFFESDKTREHRKNIDDATKALDIASKTRAELLDNPLGKNRFAGAKATKDRYDLTPRTSGFESIASSYYRIAVAGLNTDYAKTTADATLEIAKNTATIAAAVSGSSGGAPAAGLAITP